MFKDIKAAAATQAKKKGKEAPKKEEKKATGVQAKVARVEGTGKAKKNRKERRKD